MKALAHRLFWLAQGPGASRYRRQLGQPQAAQQQVLAGILKSQAGSEWGRRLGFDSIRSPQEYQQRVPLIRYADIEADVQRLRQGGSDILFKGRPLALEPSGGSSLGPRLIPYSAGLRAQFQAGLAPWIDDLYCRYPELRSGSAYWSVTPAGSLKRGLEGFESDAAYFGRLGEALAGSFMAVPAELAQEADLQRFRQRSVEALRRAKDLRFISVWHPSYLGWLLEGLDERPEKLWPQLRLISCWGDAHAANALPALKALFPGVEIQPKGLLATEGIVTLPYEGAYPLAVGSHFYEFVEEDGGCRFAWQLEQGRRYSVVLTTAGGLYRYRLQDQVQVSGFKEATPSLRFLGKEDRVSDRRGEKLEEAFVGQALQKAYRRLGLSPAFSVLAPEQTEGAEAYVLYLEGEASEGLARAVEEELCSNFHYKLCRAQSQLGPLRLRLLPPGSGSRYLSQKAESGLQLGSVKALALEPRSLEASFR